jgi:hypothetical protein
MMASLKIASQVSQQNKLKSNILLSQSPPRDVSTLEDQKLQYKQEGAGTGRSML